MSDKRHLMTEPHDGHPDTETCPGCPHDAVRTWRHSRKGAIRGVVIAEDDTWTTIRLVGDQRIGYVSATIDPHAEDGEVLDVRTSMLTEVTDE